MNAKEIIKSNCEFKLVITTDDLLIDVPYDNFRRRITSIFFNWI